ncbi:hypothetical protein [Caminibacter pacificus]|uniref:Uncharacterized protein n=1 Tax=Caminibacter pacificus TaxID=1424653 RepID=A0AAJ4RAT7_9BACT|nr:hypothetical protein [Caminibacter pacificus]QDD68166.1 hypothetical protein C6V80_09945 [Caminibacter pacificus]ROR38784.1 hypothetical protein EDC58_1999 [Caminibacter pacificus]
MKELEKIVEYIEQIKIATELQALEIDNCKKMLEKNELSLEDLDLKSAELIDYFVDKLDESINELIKNKNK